MIDIICFSTTPWEPIPTRKQQLMKRMPDSCRIFYIEPPVTYIGPIKDPNLKPYLKKYKDLPSKPKDNLLVFSLPPLIPFYNKKRVINRINQRRIAKFVLNNIYKKYNLSNPILWTYTPNAVDLVDILPHSYLIYDCIDKHSEFKGFIDKEVVESMEDELAKKSHIVFTTSAGLYNKLIKINKKTFLVPNGAEFEHFNKASKPLDIPNEMRDISHPIFGFVGVIHTWVDIDLIEFLAKEKPQWSFVLIGPVGAGVSIEKLKALSNIYHLGRIDHKVLPEYVSQFDVCLNIFYKNRLSENVSPLKFYEYLATGKPIISTSMPQVEEYSDVVYIGKDYDEILAMCEQALFEAYNKDMDKFEKRIDYAKKTSWDARVEQIIQLLKKEGIDIE